MLFLSLKTDIHFAQGNKLKKENKEVKPISLYERIVLDFPNKEKAFSQKSSTATFFA